VLVASPVAVCLAVVLVVSLPLLSVTRSPPLLTCPPSLTLGTDLMTEGRLTDSPRSGRIIYWTLPPSLPPPSLPSLLFLRSLDTHRTPQLNSNPP
jgi:hypothetical protein